MMFEVSRLEEFATPEIRSRVCKAHRRILDAITARDAETARARVEKDVKAYAKELEGALAAAEKAKASK